MALRQQRDGIKKQSLDFRKWVRIFWKSKWVEHHGCNSSFKAQIFSPIRILSSYRLQIVPSRRDQTHLFLRLFFQCSFSLDDSEGHFGRVISFWSALLSSLTRHNLSFFFSCIYHPDRKWLWIFVHGEQGYMLSFFVRLQEGYETFHPAVLGLIITSSSIEIVDVASPHWQRVHRLQPITTVYWVGQMGAGGLWRQWQWHASQTLI